MAGTVIDTTDATFDSTVVKVAGPVLAVFRAEWSDVCRALDPVLVEVAKEYSGRLVVVRHDIDQHPQTPPKHGVEAIPNLCVFKAGKIVGRWIGPANKTRVVNLIQPHL
ncbi:thioredoxin family protein [Nonomuraea sp. NPDC059023]|uniref:thioredoxin family protein n=1 Tax=unclassified Nonomuraea TaxID=2593643 RepID=UPI003684F464